MSYNGWSNAYNWKGYKTPFRRSGHKCAFSPTAAAPMLTSWFYLCSPLFLIPFSTDDLWYSAASGLRGNLVIVLIAKVFNLPSFGLKQSVKCWKTKCNHPFAFSVIGAFTITSWFSVFLYSGKERYFSCSLLSIILCKGVSMHKYKAYWHINFLLINGCGTRKNKWRSWVH